MAQLRCVSCAHHFDSDALDPSCERCGSAVLLAGEVHPETSIPQLEDLGPGVWRFGAFLPRVEERDLVTLGEGGTPLLVTRRLGEELRLGSLAVKDESRNPTGSFMDRGSTVLLSLAKGRRVKECSCITTGNLGASLAAYCAKAGIRAHVAVHQNTDQGNLYQMLAYGAELESPTSRSRYGVQRDGTLAVTAANPYLLEGEMTTGFELVQDLGWEAPDVIAVPMGTGGHLLMIWRSLVLLRNAGLLKQSKCRLLGVTVGEPPRGVRRSRSRGGRGGDAPLTELEGSEPFYLKEASAAIRESGGTTISAQVGETIASTALLAKSEGIFAEPSSASVIAGLVSAIGTGEVGRDERIVCVITGAGLKDPRTVLHVAREARRIMLGDPLARPSPQIGETKFALLRLLRARPSYGYRLRREIGVQRPISTASVYQHLSELETFGMVRRRGVEVSEGRERMFYELTRRGIDYLRIAGRLERADRAGPQRE